MRRFFNYTRSLPNHKPGLVCLEDNNSERTKCGSNNGQQHQSIAGGIRPSPPSPSPSRNPLSLTKSLPVSAFRDDLLKPIATPLATTKGSRMCQRSNSVRYQATNRLSTNQLDASQNLDQTTSNNNYHARTRGSSAMLSVNNSLCSRNNSIFSAFGGKLLPRKKK